LLGKALIVPCPTILMFKYSKFPYLLFE
jgi:hypothetical protein